MLLAGCARTSQEISNHLSERAVAKEERIPRKVYRYSVIPGGAYSGEELARARRTDSVVATHYAGFGDHVRVQLSSGTLYYMSYRKGDRVYWTSRKHHVAKGEALLSDGKHLARTRCGNRLALEPQLPTLTMDEPNEKDLGGVQPPDNPLADGPEMPLLSRGLDVPEFPESVPGPTTRTGAGEPPSAPLLSPFFSPLYSPFGPFIPIGYGGTTLVKTPGAPPGTGTSGGGTTTGVPVETIATVPEPGSFFLLLAAVLPMLAVLMSRTLFRSEVSS